MELSKLGVVLASMTNSQPSLKYEVILPTILFRPPQPRANIDEILPWLNSNVGEPYVDWEIYLGGTIVFRFKSEEDKVRFILKWL